MHLNLNFKDFFNTAEKIITGSAGRRPKGYYKELINYLEKVAVCLLPGLIGRYFFLFEPKPHLFFALELKNPKDYALICEKIRRVKRPAFLKALSFNLDSGDEANGSPAIDFFFAGTKFAFYRASSKFKPGYFHNDETKLVHCFSNQILVSHAHEIAFYKKCLRLKGLEVKITRKR